MVTISGFLRSAVAEWCPRTGPHRAGAKLPSAIGAAKPDRNAMAKLTMPDEAANALSMRERMVLFCVASGTDLQHIRSSGAAVTGMVIKSLISRDGEGVLTLTDRGRAVLRAMLPDL